MPFLQALQKIVHLHCFICASLMQSPEIETSFHIRIEIYAGEMIMNDIHVMYTVYDEVHRRQARFFVLDIMWFRHICKS